MTSLNDFRNELMKDPAFRKEYEALQPEMDITRAILDARIQAGLTQTELSKKPGSVRLISAGWKTEPVIPALPF